MIDSASDPQRERLDTLAGLMSATAIFVGLLGMTNFNLSRSATSSTWMIA